ncbi:MAG: hypothetical protein JXJ17_08425 [Anaerolineae bacterium]|nr:hypothetical protein [Anaerolineae bacterium]
MVAAVDPQGKKLVPTLWLAEVREGEVHLTVDADFVSRLPDFQPQDWGIGPSVESESILPVKRVSFVSIILLNGNIRVSI